MHKIVRLLSDKLKKLPNWTECTSDFQHTILQQRWEWNNKWGKTDVYYSTVTPKSLSFQHQQESYAYLVTKIPLILPYLVTVLFNTYISRACIEFLGPPHRLLDAKQALVALGVGHSHLPLQGLGHAFQFVYCVRSVPHNQFALGPQYTINLGKNCHQFASVNKQHRFSICKHHRFHCKKHKACKHATCTCQRNMSNSTHENHYYCFLAELITLVGFNFWVPLVIYTRRIE